ncbi:hypothetical protein ACSHDS_001661 [Vibrio alginolyticus]
MEEQSKKQLEAMISASKKAFVTTFNGLLAFFFVSLIKVATGGNHLLELSVIVFLIAAVMFVYIRYIIKPADKRMSDTAFSSVLSREALRSTFNSFLVFYSGFEIYYALVGLVSLNVDSAYDSLSELVKNRSVLWEPGLHIMTTIGLYLLASFSANLLFNYVTADSESNASTHNSVEPPSPSA